MPAAFYSNMECHPAFFLKRLIIINNHLAGREVRPSTGLPADNC
jgi:hypothetical protein